MGTTIVDSSIYVTVISYILLGTAALGATVFILDYLRTVDLGRPSARMILSTNVGIATILWVQLIRRLLGGQMHDFWFLLAVIMFLLVDFCVWYQWYLLRKIRKHGLKEGM